jgi:hypothetical protein
VPRIALLALFVLVACAKREPAQHVDLDKIRIVGEAHMRTDKVGEGRHAETASFVLVDAENASATGAYVTLAGAFTDASNHDVGALKPQSLWIPAGEQRTFALVDAERTPRPTATSARVEVRGALIADPPRAKIVELTTKDDDGLIVARATLVNDSDRIGRILVIASFHDRSGRPMTRPFSLVEVPPRGTQPLQFVGPPGSVRGTIYIGDETY